MLIEVHIKYGGVKAVNTEDITALQFHSDGDTEVQFGRETVYVEKVQDLRTSLIQLGVLTPALLHQVKESK